MLHPSVQTLPAASRRRFQDAYDDRRRPLAWGEHDVIAVELLQAWLTKLGIALPQSVKVVFNTIEPDGIFGWETRDGVIAFQRRNQLNPDGIVGHDTLDMLNERLRGPQLHTLPGAHGGIIVQPRPGPHCPPGALICAEPVR